MSSRAKSYLWMSSFKLVGMSVGSSSRHVAASESKRSLRSPAWVRRGSIPVDNCMRLTGGRTKTRGYADGSVTSFHR